MQVNGETVADKVSDREIADTLGRVRADRLRAEWEREQFDLYLAEQEAVQRV